MSQLNIVTTNLELVLQAPADVLASIEALSPSDRAHVSADWLARMHALTAPDPWICSFNMVLRASGDVIGSCGFKGPPCESTVEIGYGVEPGHQGRGYATEAARALVAYAIDNGVRTVRAHTLPDSSASTAVLTKCGFEWVGEVVDPEDGLVWRWEIRREPA
jgi:RimJ/RimL family protein N-acetyltransferase